jgi:uncharacterized protein (TIGR02271 family)
MTHTVIGFFRDTPDARKAADALLREGFDERDIDFSSGGTRDDRDYNEERSGKIGDFFRSLFSDNDYEKERYSHAARENSLVSVYVDDVNEAERAAEILDRHGAIEINEPYTSGVSSDTYQGSESDTSRSFRSDQDDISDRSVPIIEEDVDIGKREVRRDKVRVRSRIVDRPVEETLRLREETIHIERNPVDRDVTDAELNDMRDETIEVEAYGEEPMVSRRGRVVEEVKVGKKSNERQETVRESKRRTEVDIDHDRTDDEFSTDERTRNERSTDYE